MSDALQVADVTLTWAAVSDNGSDLELSLPMPDGAVTARFNVKKWDTVKPSTVDRLSRLHRGEVPLLVVADRMTEQTVERLRDGKYSWLSRQPLTAGLRGELRTGEAVYAVREPASQDDSADRAERGRPGRAAGRVAQALFYFREATQRDLVEETGVSQARISQLLTQWPTGHGVARMGERPVRWQVDDPDRLLSAWLDWYVPEERITSYWYGLEALSEQTRAAVTALKDGARVSGGLAADALAPWALPQRALIYADEARSLASAGLVPSPQATATLELVVTRDPAVVPSRRAELFIAAMTATSLPLADPLVVLWDLTRSTDLGAAEAASEMRRRMVDVWRELHRHG